MTAAISSTPHRSCTVESESVDDILPSALASSVATQTSMTLSSKSPRKEKLREEKKYLQNRGRAIDGQLQLARREAAIPVVDRATHEDVKDIIKRNFSPEMAQFLIHQLDLHHKRGGGRRFFLGPKCYRFLSTIFTLPSRRTLSRLTENIEFKVGFNDIIFKSQSRYHER